MNYRYSFAVHAVIYCIIIIDYSSFAVYASFIALLYTTTIIIVIT
jgi:hypothetical protein